MHFARTWSAILLLSMLPSIGMAEVKDSGSGGFTIENAVEVPVNASVAWDALVDRVDRWWPKDHSWWGAESVLSIEPVAGGCFCEKSGTREALHMTVTFIDPEKTLRLVGGLGPLQGMGLQGAMEFRLAPGEGVTGDSTRITLRYRVGGYSPDDLGKFAPVVDKVQAQQLAGLAEHLRAYPLEPVAAP